VIIFAVIAVLAAAAAIGVYTYRGRVVGRAPLAGAPDEIVRQFLYTVFTLHDQEKLAVLLCSSWPPGDAMSRTVSMVGSDAKVYWTNLTVATSGNGRASVTAQVGARLPDDTQAITYHGWRFSLLDESGWRVCDAEPIIV
jgi:hypothetical protein